MKFRIRKKHNNSWALPLDFASPRNQSSGTYYSVSGNLFLFIKTRGSSDPFLSECWWRKDIWSYKSFVSELGNHLAAIAWKCGFTMTLGQINFSNTWRRGGGGGRGSGQQWQQLDKAVSCLKWQRWGDLKGSWIKGSPGCRVPGPLSPLESASAFHRLAFYLHMFWCEKDICPHSCCERKWRWEFRSKEQLQIWHAVLISFHCSQRKISRHVCKV